MSTLTGAHLQKRLIDYPETDGEPMAENTLQYDWIVTIVGGLRELFADDSNVFIAGDLFWYPVEGDNLTVAAPDAMVALGRPRGHRGKYLQWEEGGVAPQVVFEVMSPRNKAVEMRRKLAFYRTHGVEEYYVHNPQPNRLMLRGYLRNGEDLAEIATMNGFVSPRLGIRFEMDAVAGLRILRPDGQPFVTYEEKAEQARRAREEARREQQRAEAALREVQRLQRQLRAMRNEPQP